MRTTFDAVMNAELNPLRRLPPAQKLQAMLLLSVMWTLAFCLFIGEWLLFGALAAGHVAVLAAAFVTAVVFRGAARR